MAAAVKGQEDAHKVKESQVVSSDAVRTDAPSQEAISAIRTSNELTSAFHDRRSSSTERKNKEQSTENQRKALPSINEGSVPSKSADPAKSIYIAGETVKLEDLMSTNVVHTTPARRVSLEHAIKGVHESHSHNTLPNIALSDLALHASNPKFTIKADQKSPDPEDDQNGNTEANIKIVYQQEVVVQNKGGFVTLPIPNPKIGDEAPPAGCCVIF